MYWIGIHQVILLLSYNLLLERIINFRQEYLKSFNCIQIIYINNRHLKEYYY